MSVSLKPLREQVMVITGASSGIGLCTAQMAAANGARVVLAARNGEALADIERKITGAGGQATHVVADVGKRADVQRIADHAVQRFGGFDTWVNDAGISIWGKLEQVSDEDSRRLFDTNFWGVVYGSTIATKYLRQRGGAIINLGSEVSEVAVPIQGMYAASKHAVKGFTDALRLELEMDKAPISVTLIRPAAINTPFTQHARNYFDREPKLPPPVYPPEEVARAILYAATHRKRDIFVGGASRMLSAVSHQAPRLTDWMNETLMPRQHFRDEPARDRAGALHQPKQDGRIHGDHPGHVMSSSLYTRAVTHPVTVGTTGALLAVAAGAAVALLAGGSPRILRHAGCDSSIHRALGPAAGARRGFFEMKECAMSIESKLNEAGHKVSETANKAGHKVSEGAEKAGDWVKEKTHEMGHRADEAAQKAANKADEMKGSCGTDGRGCS